MPDIEAVDPAETRRSTPAATDSRARAAIQAALEHRLKTGTDSFAFEALISGVSTISDTALEAENGSSMRALDDGLRAPVPVFQPEFAVIHEVQPGLAPRAGEHLVPHTEHTIHIRPFTAIALVVLVAAATSLTATIGYLRLMPQRAAIATPPSLNYVSKGLPNPALTPGDRGPAPLLSFRLGDDLRQQVFKEYGLNGADPKYTVCMLIPGSLGGTTELKNLFPTTRWFADLKVRLDKKLTDEVNSGALTMAQAEAELKADWIKAMHRHGVRNYGAHDRAASDKIEKTLNW